MDRLQHKHSLFVKLGALFGPLQHLIAHPDQYDEQERAEVLGRYCAEYSILEKEFRDFVEGQPGHRYLIQYSEFSSALNSVRVRLTGKQSLEIVVNEEFTKAVSAIDAVPIPKTSVILEAGSPFTAYCRLRQLCEMDATTSLKWLDPYFDASVFHRFLSDVRPKVPVTLITCEPGTHAGKQNKDRWTRFLDVSRLYAQERGIASYRLVVQPSLHDRWVIFDSKRIYNLGGSIKDAASRDYFTITTIESTQSNLEAVENIIISGTEFFGPNTPIHK
ncbi:MAG TPA: hypothetical protein VFW05_11275 [Verrucomicrobiae bacterium]|nr:hypothetical protein [Verrucomicrobiae bacterium]